MGYRTDSLNKNAVRFDLNILKMYYIGPRSIIMSNYAGAGFILITPDFRVLLVQDAKTKKWGFPKGHRESEDSDDLATAMRELQEETGIQRTSYIVQDQPFRITKGSSSYIFRYAIMCQPELKMAISYHVLQQPNRLENHTISHISKQVWSQQSGYIQNSREISHIQWISILDLMQNPEKLDGNKYLRTWISNLRTIAPRKDAQQFSKLVLGLGTFHSNNSNI
jgi:8-oxo-dGTP pyrophosphatase MutT (NUDIX family)